MNIVKLNDAEPGNILLEDVFNFQGLLLLKKDTALSEKNLRMLKSWGVHEITIKGNFNKGIDANSKSFSELKILVEKELINRCGNIEDEPVMQEIIKAAAIVLAKRKMKNEK